MSLLIETNVSSAPQLVGMAEAVERDGGNASNPSSGEAIDFLEVKDQREAIDEGLRGEAGEIDGPSPPPGALP